MDKNKDKGVVSGRVLGGIYKHGKVFRSKNKTFGSHDLLCLQVPGLNEKGVMFFSLYRPETNSMSIMEGLFLSSVSKDKVYYMWDSLEEYFVTRETGR